MGQFLSQIQEKQKTSHLDKILQNNSLLNMSQAKLREYYGSFKQICDTFSIDAVEFDQLFSTTEEVFRIWDTDDNGLIDSLELLSGLIIFSDSQFDEKIKFLFDLFDFNELGHISFIDLEFMIICCANSTLKIYGIRNQEVQEEDITNFLNEYFIEESKIDYQKLIKWCYKVKQIDDYFHIINKDIPKGKNQEMNLNLLNIQTMDNPIQKTQLYDQVMNQQLVYNNLYNQPLIQIVSQNQQHKIEQLNLLQDKIFKCQTQNETEFEDVSLKMNWVYGYRNQDVKQSMIYQKPKNNQKATERLIYFVSKIIIIFYPKLNEQKHYLLHEHEIIALTVSNKQSYVASSELGDNPSIHIWDSNSMKNIGVIKGQHQKGVHLMEFMHEDLYLASCEIRAQSPVLIHNLKDFSLILSTYVNGLGVELFGIKNLNQYIQQITNQNNQVINDTVILLTDTCIHQFSYHDGYFQVRESQIHKHGINTEIVNGVGYYLNNTSYILTGHKNGRVILWMNFEYEDQQIYYKTEITNIVIFNQYIVISTEQQFLHFWNLNLTENIMNIDIHSNRSLTSKLMTNPMIHEIIPADTKILLTTLEGDLLNVELNLAAQTYQLSRNNSITQIQGHQYAMGLLQLNNEQRYISVAGDNCRIYTFSIENKKVIDIFQIDEVITSLDCTNFKDNTKVQVIGCQNGKLFIRLNFEDCFNQYLELDGYLNNVKFSHYAEYLIVLSNNNVCYLFKQSNKNYLNQTPVKFQFDNEVPISIQFSDDDQSFIVGTTNKTQYKFEMKNFKSKNILQDNHLVSVKKWYINTVKQDQTTNDYILNPAIIGGETKLMVFSDDDGYIHFFKNMVQMKNNCGGYLSAHKQQISKLMLTHDNDFLYSLGKHDKMLIEWSTHYINSKGQDEMDDSYRNENNISQQVDVYDQNTLKEQAFLLYRELMFCRATSQQDIQKDNFISCKGIFYNMLQQLYDKNNEQQQFSKDQQFRNRRAPPVSIQLEYAFGFQCYDQRKTLFYVHLQSDNNMSKVENSTGGGNSNNNNNNSNNKQMVQVMIPHYIQKEMIYTKQLLQQYDESHKQCQRFIIYIVSRLVVIYNPITKQQQFYEGHKNKISCMCVHPFKDLVISGESSVNPNIHIWNAFNREPIRVIRTMHKSGILKINVSRCGSYIVTIGQDQYFSIQVTYWKFDEVICFRNTGELPIFDVMFNPYDENQVVTAGYQNLSVWEIQGRNMLRSQVIELNTQIIITCIQFISYNLGNLIQSDLITGNTNGDLAIVAHGKYIPVKSKAHQNMVNIIKITELKDEKIIIISAAEDETIKIWDTKFNLLSEIKMRYIRDLEDINKDKTKNISAQSIDLFCCQKRGKTMQNNQNIDCRLLIGTRSGQIIESEINIQSMGIGVQKDQQVVDGESIDDSSQDEQDEYDIVFQSKKKTISQSSNIQTFNFNHYLHLKFHTSQQPDPLSKKTYFAIHDQLFVMFTIGQDHLLYIWNIQNHETIQVVQLDYIPTVIKLLENHNQLVIGFSNGYIQIYQFMFQKNEKSIEMETFKLVQQEQSEEGNYVLNICVSKKQNRIAVSFDQTNSQSQILNGYIYIYDRNTNDMKLIKHENNIQLKIQENMQQIENKQTKKGVYFMEFSKCEKFLIIYNQNIDKSQIRSNHDFQGQICGVNLQTNQNISSFELMKDLEWNDLYFPNNFQAYYQYYENIDQKTTSKESNLKFSDMLVYHNKTHNQKEKYILCGSTSGDIHMFRFECSNKDDNSANQYGDQIMKDFLGKTYSGHHSFVNQIQLFQDQSMKYLLTGGVLDECVMKWKLNIDYNDIDYDYSVYDLCENDESNETRGFDKFKNDISIVLPLRKEIREVKEQVDESEYPDQEIKLQNCIGRKAFNSRNNLFYDYEERVIYIAGCNLIITDYNTQQQQQISVQDQNMNQLKITEYVKQEFINIDQYDQHSISPEISTITLSGNKKYLAAGTYQLESKIVVWDICSLSCLYSIRLKECVKITHIKFGFDNRHILVLAINKDYKQIVYLIDIQQQNILGQALFKYSKVHRYKDIEFLPNSITQFGLCGGQVMQIWQYKGQNLQYYNLKQENQCSMIQQSQGISTSQFIQKNKTQVIFMSLIFIRNIIISAGDDGYLYMWNHEQLLKQQQAHPNSTILCLYKNTRNTQFASGGTDGRIILWDMSSNNNTNKLILEKIHEYMLNDTQMVKEVIDISYHVQSLCIGQQYILCGTKTGDVYELVIPKDMKQNNQIIQDEIKLRKRALDAETIKNISFSSNSDKLITITETGNFCVWNIATLD